VYKIPFDVDYRFWFKKDLWTLKEALEIFALDSTQSAQFVELIKARLQARKIINFNEMDIDNSDPLFDPLDIIDFAITKKIPIPDVVYEWYSKQCEIESVNNATSPKPSGKDLSETERTKYLKLIGLLALALSEKSNLYKIGDRPNVSQINEAVQTILDALPDANRRACCRSYLRDSISKGLDLLNK